MIGKLRRFYREVDAFATGEDEIVHADTADRWRISMHRYRPRGGARRPYPVVAGHGFGGSHLIYDLAPDVSVARYLAEAGYDVFAIDLRGRGTSWPPSGPSPDLHWSFDDLARHDLPATVARACAIAGAEQAFWLGMEMSGQALYAAAVLGTAGQVRGGVTFGAPVLTPASARVPGVTSAPRGRRRGRVPFRAGSRLAGPILALTRSRMLESSFRPGNVDPVIPARYLRHGVPDESARIADQFADWIETGTMRSLDRQTVYSERLDAVDLPLLLIAAAHDLQRPASAVRAAFDALPGPDKTYLEAGVAQGFGCDFGHDDLLAGTRSRDEIFPRVRAWLDERC